MRFRRALLQARRRRRRYAIGRISPAERILAYFDVPAITSRANTARHDDSAAMRASR